MHELLEEAILLVTGERARKYFLTMLHKNCTLSEACAILHIPEEKVQSVRVLYGSALRHIRIYLRGRAWQKCKQIGIDDYFNIGLRGVGLAAFRNHGFTSSTERAAIRKADPEIWGRKIIKMFHKHHYLVDIH